MNEQWPQPTGGLLRVNMIHTLCTPPPIAKIQERFDFEIYVDYCKPGCKCGDTETYGTCAWAYAAYVHCKACQSMIDIVDRKTGDTMDCYKEWHTPDCQRERLSKDRFTTKIKPRIQLTESDHD